jgi:hypothetical protein
MSKAAWGLAWAATILINGAAAAAEQRLIDNLSSGNGHFKIRSTTFPGGEIRTFVNAVPEPGTCALRLVGLGLTGWTARLRKFG